MPAIESQGRNEKAVYWESNGVDNYGKYKVKSPVELDVRWEESRTQSIDSDNTVIAIDATVFVDRVVPPGSLMWKGTLVAWEALVTKSNLKEVKAYKEVPDIKCREVQRSVTLARYNEQLPTIKN